MTEKKDFDWETTEAMYDLSRDISKKEGTKDYFSVLADKYGYRFDDTGCSYEFRKTLDGCLDFDLEVPYVSIKDTLIKAELSLEASQFKSLEEVKESLDIFIRKKDYVLDIGFEGIYKFDDG